LDSPNNNDDTVYLKVYSVAYNYVCSVCSIVYYKF